MKSGENDGLQRQFTAFAAACRGVSPLYEMLAARTAGDEAVTGLLAAAPPRERRASLLFAAVHYLLLKGTDHPLVGFYPRLAPRPASGDPTSAFASFCRERRAELSSIIAARRTQPTEVQRSAVLLPAFAMAAELFGAPMTLVDIGAGGGLNLLFDSFSYSYGPCGSVCPEDSPVQLSCCVRGSTPPPFPRALPAVAHRVGIDECVLDITDQDDALWIRACVWPERAEAAAQIEGAIDLARASPPQLVSGNALDALPRVLAGQPKDVPVCVSTSATLPYLDVAERIELAEALRRFGEDHRLVWVTLEGVRYSPVASSAFKAAAVAGAGCLGFTDFGHGSGDVLALASMHGSWLEWIGPAVGGNGHQSPRHRAQNGL